MTVEVAEVKTGGEETLQDPGPKTVLVGRVFDYFIAIDVHTRPIKAR